MYGREHLLKEPVLLLPIVGVVTLGDVARSLDRHKLLGGQPHGVAPK